MANGATVTWGTYKGERGYWEWHKGRSRFVSAAKIEQRQSQGLQIIKDIEPYQNIGVDNGVIGSRRQHRDMLRAHDLVEVGNEKPRKLPMQQYLESRQKPDRAIVDALKKNSGGKWL